MVQVNGRHSRVFAIERSVQQIAGAKVNFDKSEGLRLGAWAGRETLSWPFCWSDGPARPPTRAKLVGDAGYRWESGFEEGYPFKGQGEGVRVFLILYRLSLLPLPKVHRLALQQSLSRVIW